MLPAQLEAKREKYIKWGKVGVVAVAGLAAAPVVYVAIGGMIGLGIAAVVGVGMVSAAPWVGMKFANWKLQGIKAEAMKNPIETLQNVYTDKCGALDRFLMQINDFSTHVKSFESQVNLFEKQYPQDAPMFREKLAAMKQLLEIRRDRYRDAKSALQKFDSEIQRANAVWNMSQSAQALTKAAGMGTDDPYEKIKANTAIESVETSMNRAMAELETSLLEEETFPAVPGQMPAQAQIEQVEPSQEKWLTQPVRDKVRRGQ